MPSRVQAVQRRTTFRVIGSEHFVHEMLIPSEIDAMFRPAIGPARPAVVARCWTRAPAPRCDCAMYALVWA